MRFNDAVFGVALIVFALSVWAYSGTFPEMPGQAYGPALFPRVIAAAMFVCGLILAVRGLRQLRTTGWVSLGGWAKHPRQVADFALVPLSLVLYILLSEPLGFIPVAFGLQVLLFCSNGLSFPRASVLSAITTLAVHAAFYQLLRVPLPWGVLQGVAW
jgi:putative tricarboxylic transport membrane protein